MFRVSFFPATVIQQDFKKVRIWCLAHITSAGFGEVNIPRDWKPDRWIGSTWMTTNRLFRSEDWFWLCSIPWDRRQGRQIKRLFQRLAPTAELIQSTKGPQQTAPWNLRGASPGPSLLCCAVRDTIVQMPSPPRFTLLPLWLWPQWKQVIKLSLHWDSKYAIWCFTILGRWSRGGQPGS